MENTTYIVTYDGIGSLEKEREVEKAIKNAGSCCKITPSAYLLSSNLDLNALSNLLDAPLKDKGVLIVSVIKSKLWAGKVTDPEINRWISENHLTAGENK